MAQVNTYSLARDGEKYVSKNFQVKEFRCKDGSDKILICQETVNVLQAIRDYFGRPVHINSAYRTPAYNKKVGGASKSQHVFGTACDIRVEGISSTVVAGYLEDTHPNHGIGWYPTFVHVDSRGYKVYWKNSGNSVVSTFGLGTSYTKYRYFEPEPAKEEEEMISLEQFEELYDALVEKRSEEASSDWDELQQALDWAVENGIVKGDNAGNIMPKKPITREEAILMLYRQANKH